MKFIRDNLKLILFVIVLIIMILVFISFFNTEVDYTLEYDMNDYHVKEIYNKTDKRYIFNLSKDEYSYDFAYDYKYVRKRRLINNIDTSSNNDYQCISINVFNDQSNTICTNGKDYYDNLIKDKEDNKQSETFIVYNDNYDYFVWNGYGYTNKRTNEEYNFLSKESYTNPLAYQFKEYIITPDYDQERMFNKFYIFNSKKNTIEEWKLNISLSYDSYFLGNIKDDLYLFDNDSKAEFRMNITRKKIKVISKSEMMPFYDKGTTRINRNKLIYNKLTFIYDNLYNFYIFNDNLYYKYYKSDKDIKISNNNVKAIIYTDNENVYYLSGITLYNYNIHSGETKLAESFEWNFDYNNKIFVFSR